MQKNGCFEAKKKANNFRKLLTFKVVVGVGFEPTNIRDERIYSPRPLATWIPYHLAKV